MRLRLSIPLLALLLSAPVLARVGDRLQTIAGFDGFPPGTNALVAVVSPDHRENFGSDSVGRLYFIDNASGRLVRVETDGTLREFGSGAAQVARFALNPQGDRVFAMRFGDPQITVYTTSDGAIERAIAFPSALSADLGFLRSFVVDSDGRVYFAKARQESFNLTTQVVRFDSATGTVSAFAGTGSTTFSGNGTPATQAGIEVEQMALDGFGRRLVFTDRALFVRAVGLDDGIIRTLAGTGRTGAPIADTQSSEFQGIAADSQGRIYFSNYYDQDAVNLVNADGTYTRVAGRGVSNGSDPTCAGDGGAPVSAALCGAASLATDRSGNLYLTAFFNDRIRKVDFQKRIISTVVGVPGTLACTSSAQTPLRFPQRLLVDANQQVFIVDSGAILRIDPRLGTITSEVGIYSLEGRTPDGQVARGAPARPVDATVNSRGEVIFVERGDSGAELRRVRVEDGKLATIARFDGRNARVATTGPDGRIYLFLEPIAGVNSTAVTGFIAVDPNSGAVSVIARNDPSGAPVHPGAPADGQRFDPGGSIYVFDIEVAANGDVWFAYSDRAQAQGAYRIVRATGLLEQVVPYGVSFASGIAIDPAGTTLYYATDAPKSVWEYAVASHASRRLDVVPTGGFNGFGDVDLGPDGSLFVLDEDGFVHRLPVAADDDLIPTDLSSGAGVGSAVAADGEHIAIGVPKSRNGEGEVLLYQSNACRVVLEQRIAAPVSGTSGFGSALAFENGALAIASGTTSKAKDTQNFLAGVFKKGPNGTFELRLNLSGALGQLASGMPIALAASGSNLAVGTPGSAGGLGAVQVFNVDSTSTAPTPIATLQPAAGESSFGTSVAIDGQTVAVSGTAAGAGMVSVQAISGNSLLGQVLGTSLAERFGAALALKQNRLFVGAPGTGAGMVSVYDVNALGGAPLTIAPTDLPSGSQFGAALATDDDVLLVGAPGTPAAGNATGAVLAYQFVDPGTKALGVQALFRRDSTAGALFGTSLDIADGRIVVGAPGADSGRGSFAELADVSIASRLSGLWYDPAADGEGYNIVVTNAGMVVFFYGYSVTGERLWLVSETITGNFRFGERINARLFKARSGTFAAPVASASSLVEWGLLSMQFSSLNRGLFTINGFDGGKVSNAELLARALPSARGLSGLWYDPARDGEGFNVIETKLGSVVFYYGSDSNGQRMWLVSDLFTPGVTAPNADFLIGTGGIFQHPAPSATGLSSWGSVHFAPTACGRGDFSIQGTDGLKSGNYQLLAGLAGSSCGGN